MRVLLLLLFVAAPLASQPMIPPTGGGPAPGLDRPSDDLLPEERARIQARLGEARADLRAQGLLPDASAARIAPTLSWPLRYADGLGDVHGISNFVDLRPGQNNVQDYNCGARSYDSPGYDHAGVDYFTWPFSWDLMDTDAVEVVAAAPGTIIGTDDGNFDRQCQWAGAGQWNAVYVQHDDGSVAWYGHLKNGSLTSKGVGERVERGEALGVVGSSGRSSGPHLHFELYDASGAVVEPHAGACNTGPSWWDAQRPYYDSGINGLSTHSAPVQWASCPNTDDVLNRSDRFEPGDRVYYYAFYRDQVNGQSSIYEVTTPSGVRHQRWTATMQQSHYAASWWFWNFPLPTNAEEGIWTFSVSFNGQTASHQFQVGELSTAAEADPEAGLTVGAPAPNPSAGTAQLAVSVDRSREVRIVVVDVLGREVGVAFDGLMAAGDRRVTLDVSGLPAGTYVARVESEGAIVSRSLAVGR